MTRLIRDRADTSGYWAAVWTLCPLPDVHVLCDAPIGCFNLVATAVPDYTDAIPHIENVTPSVIREDEVSTSGTGPAVERTIADLRREGLLDGKQLIVVSTAESEMIGSDLSDMVAGLHPGATFFHSESLTDDEWTGRDKVLAWLWDTWGKSAATDLAVEPGLVNIIGPTYGCFNSAADLHEVRRLIEGAGGRINLVYPFEATLAQTPHLARAQVNVLLYKEYGQTMAAAMNQPSLQAPIGMQATTDFVRELGRLLGTSDQAEAFIRHEKQTTLKAVWDLWTGPQGDWFGTTRVGIIATQTYVDGLTAFLGDELGMLVSLSAARPARPGDPDTDGVRQALHSQPPGFVFGSINEKIYLSEAGAKYTHFIPAAFPGPIVRRAVGTPFMGYRGTVYVLQEIINRLYEGLFGFLPLDGGYANARQAPGTQGQVNGAGRPTAASSGGPPSTSQTSPGNIAWSPEARQALDAALEKLPFVPRISASRELQMKAEALAAEQGATTVTPAMIATVLARQQS